MNNSGAHKKSMEVNNGASVAESDANSPTTDDDKLHSDQTYKVPIIHSIYIYVCDSHFHMLYTQSDTTQTFDPGTTMGNRWLLELSITYRDRIFSVKYVLPKFPQHKDKTVQKIRAYAIYMLYVCMYACVYMPISSTVLGQKL